MTDSDIAGEILDALDAGRQIPPLTDRLPGFDLARAAAVAAKVLARRTGRGETPVGHKLGFTNRTIWEEFNVHAPIWGPVYDSTCQQMDGPYPIGALVEPRIEPEVVFRLASAPDPDSDGADLLHCASHVALGFELVQSVYPGWRFRAADTVAACSLHGALLLGEWVDVTDRNRAELASALADFGMTLVRDGETADIGRSANVLGGGPLAALACLPTLLAATPGSTPIAPGDLLTTGTLTRALPIRSGETWEAIPDGLPLSPIRLELV